MMSMPQRRWDIDWLRVLVVVALLVPFHTYRIFDTQQDWYVKNEQLSTALNWFLTLGDTIGMQLLFLLGGAATWFALRHRSGRQYAKERLRRLLVPLVFGIVIIVPPQSYLGLRHHADFMGSFLAWYPGFFTVYPEDVEGYTMGGFTPGHLWFVLFLLVISLVALPLFLFLKREAGARLTGGLASLSTRPGTIFLLVFPLFVALELIDIYPNPFYFLTFFVFGYVLLTDERFEEAIDRHKAVALILGLVALALNVAWGYLELGSRFKPLEPWENAFRLCITSWLLIVALLGYGKSYLNSPPKRRTSIMLLGYFGEGSYPFYILHQTVIVIVGYYVVRWTSGVLVKYLAIAVAAYVVTITLYDLLVRRSNVTRFLFGMKPLKKEKPPMPAPRPG